MNDLVNRFPVSTMLATYRGSIAHNTYIPPEEPHGSDDIDLLGIHFASPEVYLGLSFEKPVYECFVDEYDVISFELKKAMRLLIKANPNVLPSLFLNDEHYIYKNFYGRALVDNRDMFLSKKVYLAFSGYGRNELAGLDRKKDVSKNYMGAKRKALVEKYGFDIRHASHGIRLLKMASEFLKTGTLKVFRDEDRERILAIKTGKVSLAEVKEEGATILAEADEAFKSFDFPEQPDINSIYKLTEEIMYDYITSNYGG